MPCASNHATAMGLPPTPPAMTMPSPSSISGSIRRSNANGLLRVALALLIAPIAIGGLLMIGSLLLTYIPVPYEVSLLLFLGAMLLLGLVPLALTFAAIFGIIGFTLRREERKGAQQQANGAH